ncbi:MAG: Glyoxalase 2 domain containing protein [Frankiales bacterium]|nr:Glyoxalase 2 domain containing protein [Frankiales bacterium]
MGVRVAHVALDVNDLTAMVAFWAAALDVEPGDADETGVALPLPGGLTLDLLRVPEPKTVKGRLHLDLRPLEAGGQDAEVARLVALGATHADVGQGPDVTWVVLADPEGNEFCVLRDP